MALREKVIYISLSIPIFVAIAGVAEETIISEAFQVAVFDTGQFHQGFVVVDAGESDGVRESFYFH